MKKNKKDKKKPKFKEKKFLNMVGKPIWLTVPYEEPDYDPLERIAEIIKESGIDIKPTKI